MRAYGPNGFYREFRGDANNPALVIAVSYEKTKDASELSGNLVISLHNKDTSTQEIIIHDNSYKKNDYKATLYAGEEKEIVFDLSQSYDWYDFSVMVEGKSGFEERFAGKVETGKEGKADPLMGGVI